MRRALLALGLLLGACRETPPRPPPAESQATQTPTMPPDETPVALNADSPIQYPQLMFDRRIEGQVVLRLFVDERGVIRPESTRVAESSGYPAFDSAAVAGSARLTFAPARKNGQPIATTFLQPVEFRHPSGAMLREEP